MNDDKLYSKLAVCQKVDNMLATDGWKDIVYPRIAAMIASCAGTQHTDGLFTLGTICTSKDELETQRNIGIRIGMVQVLNMILSHPKERDHIVKLIERQKEIDSMPMKETMAGSPYDHDNGRIT